MKRLKKKKRLPLIKEDITNLIIIFFSHRRIKLWKYEPHKKKIKGIWRYIKGLGYPPGTPDTMGWRISDGKTCGVEIKTINDTLSKVQKDILDMMIDDNCMVYVAKENKSGNIDLMDWKTKEVEVIRL